MWNEMTATNLSGIANSKSNYDSQSNIQKSHNNRGNSNFTSSLRQQSRRKQSKDSSKAEQNPKTNKPNQNRGQINRQNEDESRVQTDDLEIKGEELENLSQEKLEKLKKLLAKDVDELSDKDLESLLANLSKIFEKLNQELDKNLDNKDQIKKLVESITTNQEKLQEIMDTFNEGQSDELKSLLKELKSIQEKLLSKLEKNQTTLEKKQTTLEKKQITLEKNQYGEVKGQQAEKENVQTDLKSNLKNTMQDLKKLLEETNAKVVKSNSSGSKSSQNLANQKILSQFNLAKPKVQKKEVEQNSKLDFSTIDLEKLGEKPRGDLVKQEIVDLKSIDSDKQVIDFKKVKDKNDINLDLKDLNNSKLGQFNPNREVFNQSALTKARAARNVEFKNILNQINNKIDVKAIKQGNKITMELEPESLGKIQMKVGVEDGSVTAKILAENNGVKDLLNGNLMKLKSVLEQKGIQIDQFDVAVGYQEEELAKQNNSQQEFLFRQQQGKNKLNNFSLKLEEGQLSTPKIDIEEKDQITEDDDEIDYMA